MNIYFSGIGGVGLGPLAEIAADAGYHVLGSDLQEGLVIDELRRKDIVVNIGQDGSFLQASHSEEPIDWFIYTSALPHDHPELVLAKALGIRTAKRDELLAHIIEEKQLRLIAVAGTHGKTTTTGMLIWTFQQLGIPISYSIGTTISFGPSGQFTPGSQYFIYECDEFDRNFLHFHPYLSLITSLDYDHFDTYPTQADYETAFTTFAEQSSQLIAWQDQRGELFTSHPDAWLLDQPLDIHLPGLHNRRNATLVMKACEKLSLSGDIRSILEAFPGTDRRFERLADNLYSDYGHHPIEIAATLQLAREVADDITLVYQPHQNSRQYEIKDEYTTQFEAANTIYWLPTYLSREDPTLPILPPAALITHITNHDHIIISDFNDELWQNIQAARERGSLVLCMGAGAIDGWIRQQLAASRAT